MFRYQEVGRQVRTSTLCECEMSAYGIVSARESGRMLAPIVSLEPTGTHSWPLGAPTAQVGHSLTTSVDLVQIPVLTTSTSDRHQFLTCSKF